MSPRPRPRARTAPEGGAPPDWLRIAGLQAYGHLGVTQKERDLGQRIEADIEVAYHPRPGRPDSIHSYVNYEEVGRLVRARIEAASCRMLETLAEELAEALLSRFDAPVVRVQLRKLHVPVPGFSGTPEVRIERSRT
jgi:dihydroneopterin aldolase